LRLRTIEMTEVTFKNNDATSKEEIAIMNAAFRLLEIVIQHRIYRRSRGRSQFTSGSLVQARKAPAGLQPSAPGTNPAKIAVILAENPDVARASLEFAVEQATAAKRETWESIRNVKVDEAEIKHLSENSPIFKMFRRASQLDRVIRELGDEHLVPRVGHLASVLGSKIGRELAASTEAEAA
jgi:hypothetical protein